MALVGCTLLILGGAVCLANFYLSFVRYPIFRLQGRQEECENISGLPLVGSLAVAVSLFWLHGVCWILVVAFILILLDTAGIHWFVGTMLYFRVYGEKERRCEVSEREEEGEIR